jgi:dethiobiotin synthetase
MGEDQTGEGLFITGTDTGVGKTALAAALLATIREDGINAAPMKPVQTGCTERNGTLQAPDLDLCLRLAGLSPSPPEYELMCPYRFAPACSPHLAAAEAGVAISRRSIRDAFAALRQRYPFVVAEGAGGVRVPISDRHSMLDLMTDLALPVVIASRPGLGTLNHTLLTLDAMRNAGCSVAGVVLVETEPTHWGAIETDNRRSIEAFGRVPVLGVLPYDDAWTSRAPSVRRAARSIWSALRASSRP